MSALLEALKPTSPSTDKVLTAYYELTAKEQEAVRWALEDRSYSGSDIAGALKAAGHQVTATQVNHTRRKLREGNITL